jgi:transcriptional accessory protein Tex/SPT6
MGRAEMLHKLQPELFANAQFGVITVRDILGELKKPGRDPRPAFKAARLNDGVQDIADLKVGMVLEGTVSNVAAFGAFVDLGVHQDGLIHVSQLSRQVRQGRARDRQDRRHRDGACGRARPAAQTHRAEHAARCTRAVRRHVRIHPA